MPLERLRTKTVQMVTAVHRPESGPGGIGVVVAGASTTSFGSVYEQAVGSPLYLEFRAILRALQLGKRLKAEEISILCSDDQAVKIINRELPIEPASGLVPMFMKIRALMHTYQVAEVRCVPRSRVEPARRLAITASRMPQDKSELQGKLFAS